MRTTTTKTLGFVIVFCALFSTKDGLGQCEVTASADPIEIQCGESVDLSAFGQSDGDVVLSENFDGGSFGAGWGSTPGATSFSNPCSPGGVDGTPHAWMDNNTAVPRTLQSASYDLSTATAGVTICFDLLFASQGDAAPCEGPDEPDEGVYLEYSTDGGSTWQQIHYFDPNGGNDPDLTNWNNWCFQVPAGAITSNTIFRWHQTADSGADYDHWGIDNVEIYQNDVNAELVWTHDGYSYGVGNPGGVNPNSVSPTTTTTYTAELTTGSGDVCSDDITIVVNPPTFDIDVSADPSTICDGDCSDISGDANWILDPGGIETYENTELSPIIGSPYIPAIPFVQPEQIGEIESSMNINITTLNSPTVQNGHILNVCLNSLTVDDGLGCSGISLADVGIILSCPDGTEVILADVGELSGNTLTNMCFETGGAAISGGSAPYSGTFAPSEPLSGLTGCSSNGVWNITVFGENYETCAPIGAFTGWNITFDDPPVTGPTNVSWSPATGLSSTNTVNTQACPTATTTYTLEVDNGVAGCPTQTEDITITVDPCNGCTPPVLNIDPLTACAPNDADLNNAINASSDPANTTIHNTQADAQNDVGAIGNLVSASGSYWVRAEDPTDPTCFEVYEIVVDIITVNYNVNITDENCGNLDGEIDLTGSGGTAPYTYSIDNGGTSQGTGVFGGLSAGSYDIVVTDDNGCEATGTEVVNNVGGPTIDAINVTDPTCAGDCDGEISVTVSGGTAPYTYQWLDNAGNPIGIDDPTITGLCAGDYSIEVNDNSGACITTDNATLTDPTPEDPSFTLSDFCENSPNSATITGDAGGTFAFNPAPGDGATIDPATGEITDGVNGTTYTVEYTTGGACPETSTETVSVTGFTFNSNIVDENCGNLDGEIELIPNGGTAPYTYSIDNGATSQGSETFTNVAAGVYNVVIIDDNGCESTGTVNVNNIGGPSIDQLNATDPSCNGACDGEITVVASGGTPPYTYQWFDAAGNPIGTDSDVITGLCAGDYSVEVTDAAGGTSTLLNTNTGFENGPGGGCDCATDYSCANDAGQVFDGNQPVFTVGDEGCISSANNFTNSLGANSGTGYVYFYAGADQISTGPFTFAGGEDVELCVWYAGPQGAGASGQNTANSHFSFGVDGVQVGPDVTVPTNQGWTQFCFTVTMTAGNHTFEILSGGSAQYSLWFDDFTITDISGGGAGCPVTSSTTLTEPALDDPAFTLTDFCEGEANGATGIVTSGGTFSFNPAPGDGATIDASTGEISNEVGGTTYSVQYETPGACPETSTETVNAIAAPSFNLSQVDPSCGGTDGSIIISNLLPNTAYDVSYNDGTVVGPNNLTSDAAGEISIDNLGQGAYTDFELTINGCTTIDNSVINLVEAGAPTVSAPADIEVCIGENVTLTAGNPDGATISWDNGINDGVAFDPGAAGTTTYTVTADLNGCSVTDEVDVTVNPLPTVDAGADQTICEGESITLSGSGAQNYVWDNGVVDGNSFTPASTTTYNVVGTDANGCVNADQVTINVEAAPVPTFDGDELNGCSPHAVEFTNTTGVGTNCAWDFGDGTQAFGCGTVNHIYQTPGIYTVTLTIENAAGCTGSTTLTNYIEVTGPPTASFTADPEVTDINNTEVNFTNTSVGGVDFEWNFGDNTPNEFTYDATHEFPDEEGDSYIVTLIASNGADCADTSRLVIKVDDVIIFYVPNTFTPDGDPFNQTFQPVFTSGYDPQDFHMMIFNRWGEVIFETYDASIGWNGTYGDFDYVKDGTYVWTIEFQETMSDKRHYHQGHVNILR